jgi:YidC/Oxa1 family membrane protein insertase
MDNNRPIIAIVLMIILWSAYTLFFPATQVPSTTENQDQIVEEKVEKSVVSDEKPSIDSDVVNVALPEDYREKIFNVSTDLYDVEISSTGANIRSMVLNKYRETNDDNSKNYELIEFGNESQAEFIVTGSEGLSIANNLPFVAEKLLSENIHINDNNNIISFKSRTPSGITIIKTYKFYPNTYQIDLNVKLFNSSGNSLSGIISLSLNTPWDESKEGDRYTYVGPLTFDGESLHEDKPDDLRSNSKIYDQNISWSGFVNKYFLMIVDPSESAMKEIRLGFDGNLLKNSFISPYISLGNNESISLDYVAFFGPKEYDLLKSVGHQFENSIDYGFFQILAHPLMVILRFFYSFIGNYGFSIILLTLCIKMLFWPLTQKSYKSMQGMQKLQPEMQKLREKYGNDKQRLNQEMMSFYKENRVNPLGGCLPMLIQIPVFFALYRVLLSSIELRHAPFMLWITDLSARDPYYVTPLIMGVTMFFQQKMTPSNMDPTQQKIMLMMPVVFTFLFLNFPSGLVIYWMVNNVLTILQQLMIRRQPT